MGWTGRGRGCGAGRLSNHTISSAKLEPIVTFVSSSASSALIHCHLGSRLEPLSSASSALIHCHHGSRLEPLSSASSPLIHYHHGSRLEPLSSASAPSSTTITAADLSVRRQYLRDLSASSALRGSDSG